MFLGTPALVPRVPGRRHGADIEGLLQVCAPLLSGSRVSQLVPWNEAQDVGFDITRPIRGRQVAVARFRTR